MKGLEWRFLAVLIGCAAAGLSAGCGAKDKRPKYVAPNLSADQAAIVKANNNYWIEGVDGAKIDEPSIKLVVQPGNTVKVAPGDRTLIVKRSGTSPWLITYGKSRNFFKFTYPFRAGHTYKIGGGGSMGPGIKVTDVETGTEMHVGG